jgi:hypothetical protein
MASLDDVRRYLDVAPPVHILTSDTISDVAEFPYDWVTAIRLSTRSTYNENTP